MENEQSFLPSRRLFFLILAGYFLLHLIARTFVSPTAGIDDADQLMLAQRWSWGYGPQPPLYTWVLKAFLGTFGHSIFSLVLLRELLLLGISLLSYFNARFIMRSHACGVVAAVAVQLYPSICWESQRELNHSILASLLVLAMLLTFIRLQPGRWSGCLLLGIFGALATLSKYNACLIYLALLLAALSLPAVRPRVLNGRMLVALGLSLLLLLPHLCWILAHRDMAFASTYKFGIHATTPWLQAVRTGLQDWFKTAGAHIAPLVVIFVVIFWPGFRRRALPNDEARALWRTLLILCAAGILSVLLFKVTRFKDRWFQPVFILLPIFLAVVAHRAYEAKRLKAILWCGGFCAMLVLMLSPGRLLLTERLHKRDVLNAPFRKLAADLSPLMQQADFVATDSWMAGNLALWFPAKPAVTPELVPLYCASGRHCLLIWEVSPGQDPPQDLLKFASHFSGRSQALAPSYIEELWLYHRTGKIRLGTVMLEKSRDPLPRPQVEPGKAAN